MEETIAFDSLFNFTWVSKPKREVESCIKNSSRTMRSRKMVENFGTLIVGARNWKKKYCLYEYVGREKSVAGWHV